MDDNNHMETPSSPVSLELLDEYTGGDREFLVELTTQFWEDLEQRLPQLRASISPFDPVTMRAVAHAIAGSATCVGAEELRAKALALEECGHSLQGGQAPALFVEFETELERVKEFFDDYLAVGP